MGFEFGSFGKGRRDDRRDDCHHVLDDAAESSHGALPKELSDRYLGGRPLNLQGSRGVGQITSRYRKSCQVLSRKIFPFRFTEIYDCLCASRLHRRGVSRSSRTWEAGCDGRVGAPRRGALMRTAKPCGPDTPTLVSSSAGRIAERWWLTSPVHQGERGAAVNTIAQGMPDVLAEPVVTAACVSCCRRAMGAACARHSLRPPIFRG